MDSLAAFRTYIEAKKIYPLAIAAPKRINWAKDIPTFAEQGVDLTLYVQAGYWARKGTPADILQILETAIEKTSKDKGFIELMEKNVIEAPSKQSRFCEIHRQRGGTDQEGQSGYRSLQTPCKVILCDRRVMAMAKD